VKRADIIAIVETDEFRREMGRPASEGLIQFSVPMERVVHIQAPNQTDMLWAAEQTLAIAKAFVIATPSRSLSLTASRRLLLKAKQHMSYCLLVRSGQSAPSAAWTRWRIRSHPSHGADRMLGAPSLEANLERCRSGRPPGRWAIEWKGPDPGFRIITSEMDRHLAQTPIDRPHSSQIEGAPRSSADRRI
jgi:hypothetical protein